MAVELGTVSLQHLTHVAVAERSRVVQHAVPGLDGDLLQVAGRSAVAVELRGILYGPQAADELQQLRAAYLGQEPIDFFAEAVGEGYFTQVVIVRLDVTQRAGYLDEFDFVCTVVEYVAPPQTTSVALLDQIDVALTSEAAAFIDDVQNALNQVEQLTDLVDSIPNVGNPVAELSTMLDRFREPASSGIGLLQELRTTLAARRRAMADDADEGGDESQV